jgi:ADP-ribosyl-[dinitrogen reductase] hydrolase
MPVDLSARAHGLLLGLAVGDALGLPAEGLGPHKMARFRPWRGRFIGTYSMCSDDTEHASFVVQSLLAQPDSADQFARRLGWCLRGWFVTLPAGIGWATLRACLKLWLGFPPQHSGVFSAGNGSAMRVAPIGLRFAHDAARRHAFVRASTCLTHTDPKALTGALAIAEIIAWQVREQCLPAPADLLALLGALAPTDPDWQKIIGKLASALASHKNVAEFAADLHLHKGVSGYIYATVPVAIYAWYHHYGDFRASLEAVLNLGGDTDTVGAITGALAGASGAEIPAAWCACLWEWPRTPTVLARMAARLAECSANNRSARPVAYFWPGLIPRNILFMLIVLGHGLRRLWP